MGFLTRLSGKILRTGLLRNDVFLMKHRVCAKTARRRNHGRKRYIIWTNKKKQLRFNPPAQASKAAANKEDSKVAARVAKAVVSKVAASRAAVASRVAAAKVVANRAVADSSGLTNARTAGNHIPPFLLPQKISFGLEKSGMTLTLV
jgi:hypothetical protein